MSISQFDVRLGKRDELNDEFGGAYPVSIGDIDSVAEIRETYDGKLLQDQRTNVRVRVAGRIMRVRGGGKIGFAVLQQDGVRIQLLMSLDALGEAAYGQWRRLIDLGDHVVVEGVVGASITRELSIYADSWKIISKGLHPLPKNGVLSDEVRVRQRYLDFLLNEDARNNMRMRSKLISSMRRMFEGSDYMEVETPMLQVERGGASARPFVTNSNALGEDLYLRIAPELFLKRAVVGGFDRVFEINKSFRNEGMDSTHSPEFTMLEAYEAYSDYNKMADLVERFIKLSTQEVDVYTVERFGYLEQDWERISLYGSLSQALGTDISALTPISELLKYAAIHNVSAGKVPTAGKLVEELWEALVLPTLTGPTFVMDYPEDTSPLVAPHRTVEGVVEKWDLYIEGMEVATGYSELVDPVIQRERLNAQAALSAQGDAEAMPVDEDFLTALEYGMPPSGGIGIGIDRVMMLLTGKGIRDTVLFPLVKNTQ